MASFLVFFVLSSDAESLLEGIYCNKKMLSTDALCSNDLYMGHIPAHRMRLMPNWAAILNGCVIWPVFSPSFSFFLQLQAFFVLALPSLLFLLLLLLLLLL